MARIYYAGDWAIMMGPIFAESPFNYEYKGAEVFNYGTWLVEALESTSAHSVKSVPAWDFYKLAPGEFESILENYDIFIFSDIEARNFQLHPSFFDRSRFGKEPLTFPDRIRLLVEAIHAGKHALFLGGWLSFTGEIGKGGWGRTRLAEILPVTCLDHEDLIESTEGYRLRPTSEGDTLLAPLGLADAPPILGYNRTRAKPGCTVLATWEGDSTADPAIAVGRFGRGRVLAYTSDPAPHWGCNLVYWPGYHALWLALVEWLLDERLASSGSNMPMR
jgi:uncharacterized membrane protein